MAAKLVLALASLATVAFASSVGSQSFLGETPKIENALSAALTDARGLAPQELKGIEVAIETLVTKGDDKSAQAVAQMSDSIVNTLLPSRERSQKADKQDLDARFADLQGCSLDNARINDMVLDNTLSTASKHQKSYTEGAMEHGQCISVEGDKELVKSAYCIRVQDAEKVCGCDDAIQKLFGIRPGCKSAPAIAPAIKQCCDSFAEHKIHEAKCKTAKLDMEYAGRQHEIIMKKVCDNYSACYASKLETYTYTEKRVKANEKRRDMQTLHVIKCLVDAYKVGKVSNAQVKACKEKKYDVDCIKYPKVPEKELCKARAE